MLESRGTAAVHDGCRLIDLLRRPQVRYDDLRPFDPDAPALDAAVREQVEISVKYEGYIRRQTAQVEEFEKLERRAHPGGRGLRGHSGAAARGARKAQRHPPAEPPDRPAASAACPRRTLRR